MSLEDILGLDMGSLTSPPFVLLINPIMFKAFQVYVLTRGFLASHVTIIKRHIYDYSSDHVSSSKHSFNFYL